MKPSSVFIPQFMASVCECRSQRQVWEEEVEEEMEEMMMMNNLLRLYGIVGTLLIATHGLNHNPNSLKREVFCFSPILRMGH